MARGWMPPSWHRDRARAGWDIVNNGGSMRDLARVEGVSPAAISKWIQSHPDLHKAFIDGNRRSSTPIDEADRRLLAVARACIEGRTKKSAAIELGITEQALSMWLGHRSDELTDTINEILSERRAA